MTVEGNANAFRLTGCLIFRYAAQDWARARMQSSPTLAALEAAISKRAFFMITLVRLSPVFPFAIVGSECVY